MTRGGTKPGLEANRLACCDQPLGTSPHIGTAFGLGRNARESKVLAKFGNESGFVGFKVIVHGRGDWGLQRFHRFYFRSKRFKSRFNGFRGVRFVVAAGALVRAGGMRLVRMLAGGMALVTAAGGRFVTEFVAV